MASATVPCGRVASSTTQAWVSAEAWPATLGGRPASTSPMHGTSVQPPGSRSIASSSIPTVQGRAAAAGFHCAQSMRAASVPSRGAPREGVRTRIGAGASRPQRIV